MDRNKYNKSILRTEQGECFVCGSSTETARHEVFYGTANRRISKMLGLWINICPACHDRVHRDRELDLMLKKLAQVEFLKTHDITEFVDIKNGIGKNYLEE